MSQTIEVRVAGGESRWPGARDWFATHAAAADFSGELPELDGDLLPGEQPSALFKTGPQDERDYRRALALARGLSKATPDWRWSVSCDIEGTGMSWFGSVTVGFVDGEPVQADGPALRRYVGRSLWGRFVGLAAPQAPPAAAPSAGPGPGQLMLTYTGGAVAAADEATRGVLFDLLWPTAPPWSKGEPGCWVLGRHTAQDAALLALVAAAVTRRTGVSATLAGAHGTLQAIGVSQPLETGRLPRSAHRRVLTVQGADTLLADVEVVADHPVVAAPPKPPPEPVAPAPRTFQVPRKHPSKRVTRVATGGPRPGGSLPRGVMLDLSNNPEAIAAKVRRRAVGMAATWEWPAPPLQSDDAVFFPLPETATEAECERTVAQALCIAVYTSKIIGPSWAAIVYVQDTSQTFGPRLEVHNGRPEHDNDLYFWLRCAAAGVLTPRFPRPFGRDRHAEPPSGYPALPDGIGP